MSHDEISHPKHYDLFPDGTQAIDVIEAALTPEEFAGYLKGNFLKYRLRAGEKGPAEKCLGKSEWYRDRLANHHDFMESEAITRAEHAELKLETTAAMGKSGIPNYLKVECSPEAFNELKAAAFPRGGVFGTMAGEEWPDESRRQDAAAEDEAFARIQPYTGQGGVMIQCPGCTALSCECRP